MIPYCTADRQTECVQQIKRQDECHGEMTAIQIANDKPHACYIKFGPRLQHVESREANNMPRGYEAGVTRDLNGVVQLPLVTEWPL